MVPTFRQFWTYNAAGQITSAGDQDAQAGAWVTTALSQWFYEEYALGVLQIPKTNSLNVFPVPSDGEVTLTWERAGAPMKQVRVFDDLGRSIVSRSGLAGTSIMLDLRGNAPGHYVIEVTDGSQVERRTILLR